MAQPSGGRGWHIVTPLNTQNSPQPFSYLAPAAPRRPNRTFALVTGLSRLTFNLLLLGIVIAILAIPISIGLSKLAGQHGPVVSIHSTATPRTVAPAPPGYKQLLGNALAVNYPATWKHSTFSMSPGCGCDAPQTMQGDIFQNSDDASFAIAAVQAVPASSLQPILNVGVLPITPERTDSLNMIVTPQLGPTLDGVQWQADEYTFNLIGAQQTVHMHAVAMAANRGAYTYIIVYQAPDSQFAGLRSQSFQAMLASFRFRP